MIGSKVTAQWVDFAYWWSCIGQQSTVLPHLTALWPLHPEYSTVGAILTSCTSV